MARGSVVIGLPCVLAVAVSLGCPGPYQAFADLSPEVLQKTTPDVLRQVGAGQSQELLIEFKADDIAAEAASMRAQLALRYDDENIRSMKRRAYQERRGAVLAPLSGPACQAVQPDLCLTVVREYANLPLALVRVENPVQLAALLANENVRAIRPKRLLKPTTERGLSRIGQPEAAAAGFIGTGTAVAILDTGVDCTQDDFGGCTAPGTPACCRIVVDHEIAFADQECEDPGHGTNVARGVVGAAPGADIVSLDIEQEVGFLFTACGTDSGLMHEGINWVLEHHDEFNFVAINISWEDADINGDGLVYPDASCPDDLDIAFQELRAAGIITIAASGNSGSRTGLTWPACSDLTVSVGAVTSAWDDVATYSNTGPSLDVLAPALFGTGTSFASPVAAGTWAVVNAARPQLDHDAVLELLRTTGPVICDTESNCTPRVQIDAALGLSPQIKDRIEQGDRFGWTVVSADFNGDGLDDLAVGVVGEDLEPGDNTGAVNVLYASASGLNATGNQLWTAGGLGPVAATYAGHAEFGGSLAAGDFDNDGFADLAIGAPNLNDPALSYWQERQEGGVVVIYGSPQGLSAGRMETWTQNSAGIAGQSPDGGSGDSFGHAVAVGDFDGDGYDDLAIGVPWESENLGSPQGGVVHIVRGSAGGLTGSGSQVWHQNQPGIHGTSESGDAFGYSLATGDFNDDNYSDLVIGVPNEGIEGHAGAGMVHVIHGSAGGLNSTGTQRWYQGLTGLENNSAEAGDGFGQSLATGDFNGDGADDLAVGVPGEDVTNNSIDNAGMVHVLYGCPQVTQLGGATVCQGGLQWSSVQNFLQPSPRQSAQYGSALAVGNFDGDHTLGLCACPEDILCGCRLDYDDLAIGARGDSPPTRAGSVSVRYGGISVPLQRSQAWSQASEGITETAEDSDYFGSSLAAGDFDGDGRDDLVIGVPSEDLAKPIYAVRPGCTAESPGQAVESGLVHVVYGSADGLFILTTVCSCAPEPCDPGCSNPDGARGSQRWSQGR